MRIVASARGGQGCRAAFRRDAEVRKLLRLLRRPQLLEKERLAILLRHALRAENARVALLAVIEQTFSSNYDDQRLGEIIQRCDVRGEKARLAAASMHLSLRQFFRHRAEAVAAVASSIAARLDGASSSSFDLALAQMISVVEPDAALDLFRCALTTESEVPLAIREDIGRCVAWAQRNSAISALGADDARWVATMHAERAGMALLHDHAAARLLLAQARTAIRGSRSALEARALFTLTEYDLLLARLDGDLPRAGTLVAQLAALAGKNEMLHALALAEQAQQALLEGALVRAVGLLNDAEGLATLTGSVKACSRIALVKTTVLYLDGNHADAHAYARAATAALSGSQPAYAMQAAALTGRVALALGKPWDFPQQLVERFPKASLRADLETVRARHVMQADLNRARRIASGALELAQSQGARVAEAFARATLSAIADAQHRAADARALRALAWQEAVSAGDHLLLYDIFAESLTANKRLTPITA